MKTKASTLAIAAAAAMTLAGGAWAQTAAGSTSTPSRSSTATTAPNAAAKKDELARSDVNFLKQASQNGHAEIESSKLAQQKATSDAVKSFAKKMVDDHTKSHEELMALAQRKGVSDLPTEPSTSQKAKLERLSKADAGDFDHRYIEEMGVKAHEDTVKLFRKASQDAKDADVKSFAAKALPTLESHLKSARDLEKQVSAKASDGKRTAGSATSGTSGSGTSGAGKSSGGAYGSGSGSGSTKQ